MSVQLIFAQRLSHRPSRLRFHALPLAEPLALRPCNEWQSNCLAIGLARISLAVRALGAHQRQSIGRALGKALPKTFRPSKSPSKRPTLRAKPFSTFFFPLRSPLTFATLATVSSGPSLPKRRGQPPFPFGLKGKMKEKANVCNGPRGVSCGLR